MTRSYFILLSKGCIGTNLFFKDWFQTAMYPDFVILRKIFKITISGNLVHIINVNEVC